MQQVEEAPGSDLFSPWIFSGLHPDEAAPSAPEVGETANGVHTCPMCGGSRQTKQSTASLDADELDPRSGPRGLVFGVVAGSSIYATIAGAIYYFRH